MSDYSTLEHSTGPRPFILTGLYLAIAYWLLEALVDSWIVEASFLQRLLPSADSHELWMRGCAFLVIFGFGFYAHWMHVRLRSAHSLNQEAATLLRNAIEKTIRGYIFYCIECRKIQHGDGFWIELERFVAEQTDANFSPGICDSCLKDHGA